MKWWSLLLGIALLQVAVFIETTEAKGRDTDGDGTPDNRELSANVPFANEFWASRSEAQCFDTLLYRGHLSLQVFRVLR